MPVNGSAQVNKIIESKSSAQKYFIYPAKKIPAYYKFITISATGSFLPGLTHT